MKGMRKWADIRMLADHENTPRTGNTTTHRGGRIMSADQKESILPIAEKLTDDKTVSLCCF